MADLGHDPVSGAPVSGLESTVAPEDQSGQTIGWQDDPCAIEEAIEDPGAVDFVGVSPLAADVIPDDQVTMWSEPESEEAPDISPLDWYFATAPPEEYDVPPPAYADDTDDGSETDPAPFVYVGSLAAPEHDTPTPVWNEDTDDGSEGDVSAWGFVSSLATDEHDTPAPALAEVDGDDDAPDVAAWDFVASLATDEHDVSQPALAEVDGDDDAPDAAPWDFAAAGVGEDAAAVDEPLPQFATGDDADEADSDAAYDFNGWSQPEDAVAPPVEETGAGGGRTRFFTPDSGMWYQRLRGGDPIRVTAKKLKQLVRQDVKQAVEEGQIDEISAKMLSAAVVELIADNRRTMAAFMSWSEALAAIQAVQAEEDDDEDWLLLS